MSDDGPLPVDTGRGLSLWYRGRALYSRRDPLSAPARAAQAASAAPSTLYLVPSPCLCHGLRELAARADPGSLILCVESDEALMAVAMESLERLALPRERIRLLRCADTATAAAWARGLGRFRRVEMVRLSAGYELDRPFYDGLFAALAADAATGLRNRVTLARMGRLWGRNLVGNLASLPWEEVTEPVPDDSPSVVCGAGPSLDLAIPLLRTHADRLTVVACDTACGALARAGVRVDEVVCLEGQVYNLPDFLPLDGRPVRLFADLSSHPSSFRAVRGPKTVVASVWGESGLHPRLAASGLPLMQAPPLGSVGVLALRIAAELHRGPLFVAGLDFAFQAGRTHCSGSPVELAEAARETRLYRRDSRWAASWRQGVHPLPGGRLSDPALDMYAALARDELSRIGRERGGRQAVDMRGGLGQALGIPGPGSIEPEAVLASLPKRQAGVAAGTAGAPGSRAAEWRERARAFLATEAAELGRLRAALRDGCPETELRARLERCDWIYDHFPDPERVGALELDALKRVALESSYWQGRLEAALD